MTATVVLLCLFTALALIFTLWLVATIWPAIDKDRAKEQVGGKVERWRAYWKAKFSGPRDT